MFANNQTARMFRQQNSVGVESTCPLIGEINDCCFIANIHFADLLEFSLENLNTKNQHAKL